MIKVFNLDTRTIIEVELRNAGTLEFLGNDEDFAVPEIERAEYIYKETGDWYAYDEAITKGLEKLGYEWEADDKTIRRLLDLIEEQKELAAAKEPTFVR